MTSWPQNALDYLAGGPLDSDRIVVVGRRHRARPRARLWYPTPSDLFARADPGSADHLLWEIPAETSEIGAAQLADLARMARGEVGLVLQETPLAIPLDDLIDVALAVDLCLCGIEPIAIPPDQAPENPAGGAPARPRSSAVRRALLRFARRTPDADPADRPGPDARRSDILGPPAGRRDSQRTDSHGTLLASREPVPAPLQLTGDGARSHRRIGDLASQRVYDDWTRARRAREDLLRQARAERAALERGESDEALSSRVATLLRFWAYTVLPYPRVRLPELTAEARAGHPSPRELATWWVEHRRLERACEALSGELEALQRMRSFRAVQRAVRYLRSRSTRTQPSPATGPAPPFRSSLRRELSMVEVTAQGFAQRVASTRGLQRELESLRRRAARLVWLPFRMALWLRPRREGSRPASAHGDARGGRPHTGSRTRPGRVGSGAARGPSWISIIVVPPACASASSGVRRESSPDDPVELEKSLSSVRAQTDPRWQLLWLDRGCCAPGRSGGTEAWGEDPRISRVSLPEIERGLEAAIGAQVALALRLVESPWVTFMAVGDVWLRDRLERARQDLEELGPTAVARIPPASRAKASARDEKDPRAGLPEGWIVRRAALWQIGALDGALAANSSDELRTRLARLGRSIESPSSDEPSRV